ncbi:hypothetical protein D9V86_09915 [Bacteroidetes/Chlorobi group bacterium ChocPot_Mid]|nr:MAG: hypothetical protein D9V86_09915 [Bacteroidetes/Chlorobi group bacterium ChocPot_Mid]
MNKKQTKSKKKLNSFKTEMINNPKDTIRITVDLDEETYRRLKFMVKKYNYSAVSKYLRDMINTYYNDFFNN